MATIDTDRLKGAVDLQELASRYAGLKRWAAGELAGPCPKCGGKDRLHVKADWWYCNQCYPYDNGKPHDAIAFVQWLEGCDFREACARLGGGVVPACSRQPSTPPKQQQEAQPWQSEEWQKEATNLAKNAAAMLTRDAGKPVRDYLEGRGLRPETWTAFGLGAARWTMPKSRRKALAAVIPWTLGEYITAVKFRFPQGSKENGDRFTSKSGGRQALFGFPLLGQHLHTLILCEGELNAMSLWQTVHDIGREYHVDVVSFGSQGEFNKHARKLAAWYAQVVVWADESDITRTALDGLGAQCLGLKSPRGLDANDLLQRGKLTGFLSAVLERFGPSRPVTRIWPAGSNMGVIDGKWRELPDGRIEATYTPSELEAALLVARAGGKAA